MISGRRLEIEKVPVDVYLGSEMMPNTDAVLRLGKKKSWIRCAMRGRGRYLRVPMPTYLINQPNLPCRPGS